MIRDWFVSDATPYLPNDYYYYHLISRRQHEQQYPGNPPSGHTMIAELICFVGLVLVSVVGCLVFFHPHPPLLPKHTKYRPLHLQPQATTPLVGC